MTSATPKTPKTVRKIMRISPTKGPVEMREELTFAPRKKQGVKLIKFLNEDVDVVKHDFSMSDGRVGRFVFDKVMRTVKLYTGATEEDFTSECAFLLFPAKDWYLFYNHIWRDLNDCDDAPLYMAEWSGVIPDTRFRVVGDRSKKCLMMVFLFIAAMTRQKPQKVYGLFLSLSITCPMMRDSCFSGKILV